MEGGGFFEEQDSADWSGSTAVAPSPLLDKSEELDTGSTFTDDFDTEYLSRLIFFSPSELLFVDSVTLEALIVLISISSNSIFFWINENEPTTEKTNARLSLPLQWLHL